MFKTLFKKLVPEYMVNLYAIIAVCIVFKELGLFEIDLGLFMALTIIFAYLLLLACSSSLIDYVYNGRGSAQ